MLQASRDALIRICEPVTFSPLLFGTKPCLCVSPSVLPPGLVKISGLGGPRKGLHLPNT